MTEKVTGPRGISDATVREKTGKGWAEWCAILDAWGMKEQGHRLTAKYLEQTHGVSGWWAQSITARYEWDHDLRDVAPADGRPSRPIRP